MKKIVKEFGDFVARGNVMDLSVGVIVGGAFGKIVTSLVDDILMPILGVILGGIDFSGLTVTVGGANIAYGRFVQNVVDFVIVAFCIFLMVKAINKFIEKGKQALAAADKQKAEAAQAAEQEQAAAMKSLEEEEVELLRQIRDSLQK